MKRDPALTSLSHDHHQALFVAQKLRRARAESAADARAAFLTFWNGPGHAHFRIEEQVLLPAYAGHGDPHHPLVARALCDHVEIRSRAAAVARDPAPGAIALNELGARIGDHVRLEERELFPLIEQTLPAERLATLAAELAQAEAAEGTPADG
jgi:hemerythrin HHE cation binding domain-containing protein